MFLNTILEMKTYLILWLTQLLSALGSAMTAYALVIWSYGQEGSALQTALLMVCSYAPYVLCSMFAGALSDRWDKRRTMLVCDVVAAGCTLVMLALLRADQLQLWHVYALNALLGLMNTVQQPASELATTLLLPRKHYQRVGAMSYLSSSVSGILAPVLASAMLGLWGMDAVMLFDLATFAVAFVSLLLFIRIPATPQQTQKEKMLDAVGKGLSFLRQNQGVFDLILFLAAINLVASLCNAALPAMMLSRNGGSAWALGTVNATISVATLVGSIVASVLHAPRSRIRVVCNTLLFSMSFENFLMAFGRSVPIWCIGGFLGWIAIPLMNANLNAIMRLSIPEDIQGRVYAARNTLQFFTIPLGYLLGGWLIDRVFEPMMAMQSSGSLLLQLFGIGKGSGAACFFAVLAVLGISVCLIFQRDPHLWALEKKMD